MGMNTSITQPVFFGIFFVAAQFETAAEFFRNEPCGTPFGEQWAKHQELSGRFFGDMFQCFHLNVLKLYLWILSEASNQTLTFFVGRQIVVISTVKSSIIPVPNVTSSRPYQINTPWKFNSSALKIYHPKWEGSSSKHDLLGSMLIFTTQSCFSPQEPASSITYIRSRKIHEWIQSVDQMSLRKGVAFPKDPKKNPMPLLGCCGFQLVMRNCMSCRFLHFSPSVNINNLIKASWWFQPIWKIWVKLDHFPK